MLEAFCVNVADVLPDLLPLPVILAVILADLLAVSLLAGNETVQALELLLAVAHSLFEDQAHVNDVL